MSDSFVVRRRDDLPKEDSNVVMTLRIDRELQSAFDELARKSGYSRNKLMGMALRYALEHLDFVEKAPETE